MLCIGEFRRLHFNPASLNLQEKGDSIDLNFPAIEINLEQRQMIKGIEPVIINITPLLNLIPLLGLKDTNEKQEISSL